MQEVMLVSVHGYIRIVSIPNNYSTIRVPIYQPMWAAGPDDQVTMTVIDFERISNSTFVFEERT